MYYVKPLLSKFVEFMGEPVEIFSFDPPGYGASEPPNDWDTENLESELQLLQQVIAKSTLRKPFILIGGSIGGLLAHLYYLRYPEDVTGIIFLDPTPFTVFEQGSPAVTNMNRLRFTFRIMAGAASLGFFRPVSFLLDYFGVGDFGYFFRPSQPGYIALTMTQTMLQKVANQLRFCNTIPDYISKLQNDTTIRRDLPLLVISVPDSSKKQLCGGLTEEEALQWWCHSQQLFLRSSDNAGFIFRADYNHVQCVLDMELAAKATKAILTQIHNNNIH
jgi:pimeloyl-ACP methyl ester carboxylesterase